VIGLALSQVLAGCASTPDKTTGAATTPTEKSLLRVGVAPDYPPIIFTLDKRFAGMEDELFPDGQHFHGLDAELAAELAQELGMEIQFVELPWEDLLPALRDNRIDIIMAGMSITQERRKRVAFSAPYLRVGHLALARQEDVRRYTSKQDLRETSGTVAVIEGTTGDRMVMQLFRNAERRAFTTPEDATKAVLAGKADLFVHDAPAIWWMAAIRKQDGARAIDIPLSEEDLCWAVRLQDTELLRRVNAVLAGWKTSGKLAEAIARWMPPQD
jgi:polar amino acid transport system substrate-binding protein